MDKLKSNTNNLKHSRSTSKLDNTAQNKSKILRRNNYSSDNLTNKSKDPSTIEYNIYKNKNNRKFASQFIDVIISNERSKSIPISNKINQKNEPNIMTQKTPTFKENDKSFQINK